MSVCAETIYRACYANDARSGLPSGLLGEAAAASPGAVGRAASRSGPLGFWPCATLGGIPADSRPARRRRGPSQNRPLGTRPHRRQSEPHRAVTLAERTSRYTVVARRLQRAGRRRGGQPRLWAASLGVRSCARAPGTKAARWPAGPTSRPRSASRCSSARRARRGSGPTSTPTALLRRWRPKGTSLDIATAPCGHRGQTQPHATPTSTTGQSAHDIIHSPTHLQPPVELAEPR